MFSPQQATRSPQANFSVFNGHIINTTKLLQDEFREIWRESILKKIFTSSSQLKCFLNYNRHVPVSSILAELMDDIKHCDALVIEDRDTSRMPHSRIADYSIQQTEEADHVICLRTKNDKDDKNGLYLENGSLIRQFYNKKLSLVTIDGNWSECTSTTQINKGLVVQSLMSSSEYILFFSDLLFDMGLLNESQKDIFIEESTMLLNQTSVGYNL